MFSFRNIFGQVAVEAAAAVPAERPADMPEGDHMVS